MAMEPPLTPGTSMVPPTIILFRVSKILLFFISLQILTAGWIDERKAFIVPADESASLNGKNKKHSYRILALTAAVNKNLEKRGGVAGSI